MSFDEQHALALRSAEQWRQAALAFELRAMRVEYMIRLLVAAGHVSQQKVDEAFEISKKFGASVLPSGAEPNRQNPDGGERG